jgi:hypothetical protein
MAWNDLTFVDCSLLTAAKMTALQGNFAALAAGEPGAPPLRIDGVSSLATVHASSGLLAPQVSSLGRLHVSSGLLAPGIGSAGLLHVSSGLLAPQVSSLALLHVGSGLVCPQVGSLGLLHVGSGLVAPQVSSLGAVALAGSPSGTPGANTLYPANLCKAWVNFDGTGSVSIRDSFNVASVTDNGPGDFTVVWERDFADTDYAVYYTTDLKTTVSNFARWAAGPAVGSIIVRSFESAAYTDMTLNCVLAFGAQ